MNTSTYGNTIDTDLRVAVSNRRLVRVLIRHCDSKLVRAREPQGGPVGLDRDFQHFQIRGIRQAPLHLIRFFKVPNI